MFHGDTVEKYLKCIQNSIEQEKDRIYFWLKQKNYEGRNLTLWEAIEATVENPRSFDSFYKYEMRRKKI